MRNIVVMLVLLVGGFLVARVIGCDLPLAASSGLAAVFLFTALGHFLKCGEMAEMLPSFVPARKLVVVLSGLLEVAFALGVLYPGTRRHAALLVIVFLILVTPLNISSALRKVDFGGHAEGPRYLWVRLPLQVFLIWWSYWLVFRAA